MLGRAPKTPHRNGRMTLASAAALPWMVAERSALGDAAGAGEAEFGLCDAPPVV
jgi:hypothetical protein